MANDFFNKIVKIQSELKAPKGLNVFLFFRRQLQHLALKQEIFNIGYCHIVC